MQKCMSVLVLLGLLLACQARYSIPYSIGGGSVDYSNGGALTVGTELTINVYPNLQSPSGSVLRTMHTTVDPTGGLFGMCFGWGDPAGGRREKAMWLLDARHPVWEVSFCRVPFAMYSLTERPDTCDPPLQIFGFSGPFTFRLDAHELDAAWYTSFTFNNGASSSGYTTSVATRYYPHHMHQLIFGGIPQTVGYMAVALDESKERILCSDCAPYRYLSGTTGVVFDEKVLVNEFRPHTYEIAGESDLLLEGWSVNLWVSTEGGDPMKVESVPLEGYMPNTPAGAGFLLTSIGSSYIDYYPHCAISIADAGGAISHFISIRGQIALPYNGNSYGSRYTGYDHSQPLDSQTSMQLVGSGNSWIDFTFQQGSSSFHELNNGQTFVFR